MVQNIVLALKLHAGSQFISGRICSNQKMEHKELLARNSIFICFSKLCLHLKISFHFEILALTDVASIISTKMIITILITLLPSLKKSLTIQGILEGRVLCEDQENLDIRVVLMVVQDLMVIQDLMVVQDLMDPLEGLANLGGDALKHLVELENQGEQVVKLPAKIKDITSQITDIHKAQITLIPIAFS